MKKDRLLEIIREEISAALTESETIDLPGDPNKLNPKAKESAIKQARTMSKDMTIGTPKNPVEFVEESDIDEMARIPKGYKLTNDDIDTSGFTKTISGTSLADVIEYFKENPGADKKSLQSQFNFARPQIANAVVNALLDAGVLVKLGAGGEEEPAGTQAQAPAATDAEDMFVGGAENPLAMYFDGEPNADGSEDMVEPEEDVIEKAPMAGQLSDEDYEAFMQASTLEDRISKVKSDILKTKRSKPGGEFSSEPSTELDRLRALRTTLEKRLADLVAGSKYLQKRSGVEAGDIELEDTEEPIQEVDQYDLNKMKFYAGIIK
jgi:hypothetical protein